MLGIDKENVTREVTTKAMMASLSYFDVVIPLLGYHWLDFGVNGEEDPLIAMWDRSWHATMDALGTAPSTGTGQALIANANAQQSPYKCPERQTKTGRTTYPTRVKSGNGKGYRYRPVGETIYRWHASGAFIQHIAEEPHRDISLRCSSLNRKRQKEYCKDFAIQVQKDAVSFVQCNNKTIIGELGP